MEIFSGMARIVFSLVFSGLFILFVMPVVLVGIVNVGNVFGAVVSALLTAICIFPEKFRELISLLQKSTGGKIILYSAGTAVIVFAVTAVIISALMVKTMNNSPKDENTTLVVLGCKVKNGSPSLMLRRRLDTAYEYLSLHENVKAVVSGGQGEDESISEAECMKDYLVSKGISPDRIYMEDKSVNTQQNLSYSREIIKNNNLCEAITIVTDGFHQYRAGMFAKKQGIEPYSISGYTTWWLVPSYWVREWFGIVYYAVFG
ncbi:MAG: YdcF family protein [Ruminococcus sp.]|nr:YdcF family protein [Ruminococcus sp.]